MTTPDADGAGLMEAWDAFDYCCKLGAERGWCSIEAIHLDTVKKAYESQQREIEELRRDIAKMTEMHLRSVAGALDRALRAEAALAEAVNVIAPFAKAGSIFKPRPSDISDQLIYAPAAGEEYDLCGDHLRAASAFAEKHGGRDG